jgi:molybdopterin-guanine dinucleotide biosynthesis protein A
VNAYILAGGKSSRMGIDKSSMVWQGISMLERMKLLAEKVCERVYVIGNQHLQGDHTIQDIIPEKGPAGGILTAMRHVQDGNFLLLACDMPLLNVDWLNTLISASRFGQTTITMGPNGMEPLCAVYCASFADTWEKRINEGVLKLSHLIEEFPVETIEIRDQLLHEPDMLLNLNTPSDFVSLQKRSKT